MSKKSTRVLIPCWGFTTVQKRRPARRGCFSTSCAFFQSGRFVLLNDPARRSRQIRRGGARSGPAATLAPRWITHGTSATCTRCARGAASARWRGRSRSPRSSRSRTSPSRRRPRCAPRRGRRGWACRWRSRRRSSRRRRWWRRCSAPRSRPCAWRAGPWGEASTRGAYSRRPAARRAGRARARLRTSSPRASRRAGGCRTGPPSPPRTRWRATRWGSPR